MRKIWHPILLSVSYLWGLSCDVSLWASTEEESSRPGIVEAKTFDDLQGYLENLLPTDALGWDCDNTWVSISYPELPGFFDFESCREFKHLWKEAGDVARSEGLFQGNTEEFGAHCFDVLQRKNRKENHLLLEPRMLEIHEKARSQGCDSFVCTGLSPDDEKVDFLKRSGFDLSGDYKRLDHVNSLFAGSRFSCFPGWLFAPDNKARSMMAYMEQRNLDRQSMLKPPLTRLFYADNDLGTLMRIEAGFKMTGIELVLIHWRVHALAMEEKYRLGQLIPQILEGYRTLTKPAELCMGFGSSLRDSQRSVSLSNASLRSSAFVGISLSSLSYDHDSEDESTPLPGFLPLIQERPRSTSPTPGEGFETGSAYNSDEEGAHHSPGVEPTEGFLETCLQSALPQSPLNKSGDTLDWRISSQ